jgi:hypothetical protein
MPIILTLSLFIRLLLFPHGAGTNPDAQLPLPLPIDRFDLQDRHRFQKT